MWFYIWLPNTYTVEFFRVINASSSGKISILSVNPMQINLRCLLRDLVDFCGENTWCVWSCKKICSCRLRPYLLNFAPSWSPRCFYSEDPLRSSDLRLCMCKLARLAHGKTRRDGSHGSCECETDPNKGLRCLTREKRIGSRTSRRTGYDVIGRQRRPVFTASRPKKEDWTGHCPLRTASVILFSQACLTHYA